MIVHRLGERAEDDAHRAELVLEGGRHRHAVEHRVHGHTRQQLAFLERDTELFIGLEQLRIDLVETLGGVLAALRRGVIDDVLIVDPRIVHVRPLRLRHREPVAVSLETPREHELGFVLLRRDGADNVLAESGRQRFLLHVGDETGLVFALDQGFDILFRACHDYLSTPDSTPFRLSR